MRESARERAQRFVPPPDSFSADFLEYSEEEALSSEEETPRRHIQFDNDEAARRLLQAKGDIKGRAIIKKKVIDLCSYFSLLFGIVSQRTGSVTVNHRKCLLFCLLGI
jgi:hypothetical protein